MPIVIRYLVKIAIVVKQNLFFMAEAASEGKEPEAGEELDDGDNAKSDYCRYPSIKTVSKRFTSKGAFTPGGNDWIVEEKIHGANAGMRMSYEGPDDTVSVRFGRRTNWTGLDETFYGWQRLLETHTGRLLSLFRMYRDGQLFPGKPSGKTLYVYGEVFGGSYPHPDVPIHQSHYKTTMGVEPGPVQHGIYYCPDVRYCVYDIWSPELGFLGPLECAIVFERLGFLHAKPLMRGTLEECLNKIDLETFVTTYPDQFGFPRLPASMGPNYAEGIVIKPVVPFRLTNGNRAIFKCKRAAFREKGPKGNNPRSRQPKAAMRPSLADLSPEALETINYLIEDASRYIVEPRLNNVISKLGPGKVDPRTGKPNYARIAGHFAQDALKEFAENKSDTLASFEPVARKLVLKAIGDRLNSEALQFVYNTFMTPVKNM